MRAASAWLALAAAALAGCEATPPPGTGWSRASDLSVYSAMLVYGDVARQQSVLCGGFATDSVDSHWREDFGARTDAVTTALIARHGAAAVSEAEGVGGGDPPSRVRGRADLALARSLPATAATARDAAWTGLGEGALDFISILSIFILSCFIGYYVVWSVTPALHTPLMSVTNAISSVIIVGALIAALAAGAPGAKWLGLAAVVMASVNIFGGFAVTERMLAMYKPRERKE